MIDTDDDKKITSVGSFIEAIEELGKNEEGSSTEIYFRGQEVR